MTHEEIIKLVCDPLNQALSMRDAEISRLRKALTDGCMNWCGCSAEECKMVDCSAYKALTDKALPPSGEK